jgi:outer membrane protein TolC
MKLTVFKVVFFCYLLSACSQSVLYAPKAELAIAPDFQNPIVLDSIPRVFDVDENVDLKYYLDEVRQNNKNLKSLKATVQALTFGEKVLTAQSRPNLDANLTGQRERADKDLKPANTVDIGLNAKWVVDIWGKLADESLVANLQIQQQVLVYQNTQRVLLAQAMQTWLSFWSAHQQERIVSKREEIAQSLFNITEGAYKNGSANYEVLIEKRSTVGLLKEQQVQNRANKAIVLHRLNILRGQSPKSSMPITQKSILPVVTSLPTKISATTLAQRPDILSAFKQIEILDAKTRAAHKALLPQLSLSSSLTRSSTSLNDALGTDLLWQLVGGVTQPLFNGGQLRNLAKQKSKEAESSFFKYEAVVLNAMEEVENALMKESSLAQQLSFFEIRLKDLENRSQSLEEAYQDGTVSVQSYLNAQEPLLMTKTEWIILQESYLSNRISLALAIGQPLNGEGN